MLKSAGEAVEQGDYGWAMDLLTHLVRVDHDDMPARRLKARAMRQWAYEQKNMYWRNFALGGAAELEDTIDYGNFLSFEPPDVLRILPPANLIERLRVRLDPDRSADADLVIGFRFTDPDSSCAVEVRRGVAVIHEQIPERAAATIVTTVAALRELVGSGGELAALADGVTSSIKGSGEDVTTFFGYFDRTPPNPSRSSCASQRRSAVTLSPAAEGDPTRDRSTATAQPGNSGRPDRPRRLLLSRITLPPLRRGV